MLPEPFRGLVDDAAVFPPGDAPLPEALAAYVGRRPEPLEAGAPDAPGADDA